MLAHALNPYGFAWRRRANERNVDLNRNFLDADEAYAGAPPLYDRVHRLLNPDTPPPSADLFAVRAAGAVCRYGLPALRSAVAEGQYDHPSGLFFGGHTPEASTRMVRERFRGWTRDAGEVVHLDLHTGLGRHADCQILVEPVHAPEIAWYRQRFDPARVVSVAESGAYAARGVMGAWLGRHAEGRRVRFACVEIGTFSTLRVLRAPAGGEPGPPVLGTGLAPIRTGEAGAGGVLLSREPAVASSGGRAGPGGHRAGRHDRMKRLAAKLRLEIRDGPAPAPRRSMGRASLHPTPTTPTNSATTSTPSASAPVRTMGSKAGLMGFSVIVA